MPFMDWDTAAGIPGFPLRSKWNSSSEWLERSWFAPSFCCFVVQLLSRVPLFLTPWTTAHQAPLFSTISQSLLKFMSIESEMPSYHLILCLPLLLLPSVFPSIKVFSSESSWWHLHRLILQIGASHWFLEVRGLPPSAPAPLGQLLPLPSWLRQAAPLWFTLLLPWEACLTPGGGTVPAGVNIRVSSWPLSASQFFQYLC